MPHTIVTTYHLPGTRAAFLQEPFLADTWQSHPTGGTMLIFPNGWNLLVPIPPWVAPSCLSKENPLLFWCRTANSYYPDVQCLFILEIYIFVVMKLYYIFCKSHMCIFECLIFNLIYCDVYELPYLLYLPCIPAIFCHNLLLNKAHCWININQMLITTKPTLDWKLI